jgi:hypothetical protein
LSTNGENQKAVDAVYCDAYLDGKPIYLIVDTGSTGSLISKVFLDKIGRTIDTPSTVNMVDVNGGKKRSLGKVKQLPINIKGTIIPVDVDVSESASYSVIVGNDWLTKTKGIIDFNHRILELNYNNRKIRCGISCWEKPKYDEMGIPTGLENAPIQDKEILDEEIEENDASEDQQYCVLLGDTSTKPLMEMDETTITIGDRKEPITYIQELKQLNHPMINDKSRSRDWKGPNAVCWCDHVLDTETDICKVCQQKVKDLELVQMLNQEYEEKLPKEPPDLTKDQGDQLQKLLEEYDDVIAREGMLSGRTNLVTHSITTDNSLPIKQRPYRLSPAEHDFVGQELENMMEQGIIQPSSSPWASPIVLVKKKNGKMRFCVDYRKLNKVTKRDAYPLPRIDEILDSLGKAKWFTSLDLASGYWQVEMNEQDKEKTAFVTKQGIFEFNVMPFGLTNAPATFQRLMDRVFYDIKDKYVLVYLDDINIYSSTFEEHMQHLKEVLERFRRANLKLNLDKCHFCKREISFLGHLVNEEGIKPDPTKVDKVKNFPIPTNTTELRGFIGLASYYRRFVQDFATIVEPMNRLLRKDIPFIWNEACGKAFEFLKEKLTTAPILIYPDFSKPFILHTDASYQGLGAVLAQEDAEGHEHVVAYASRSLVGAEYNYAATEIECLASVWAMKYFRPYIYMGEFTLVTDHSALQWMMNNPTPSKRMTRWILTISDYPFKVCFRKGKKHQNADALSRLSQPNNQQQ